MMFTQVLVLFALFFCVSALKVHRAEAEPNEIGPHKWTHTGTHTTPSPAEQEWEEAMKYRYEYQLPLAAKWKHAWGTTTPHPDLEAIEKYREEREARGEGHRTPEPHFYDNFLGSLGFGTGGPFGPPVGPGQAHLAEQGPESPIPNVYGPHGNQLHHSDMHDFEHAHLPDKGKEWNEHCHSKCNMRSQLLNLDTGKFHWTYDFPAEVIGQAQLTAENHDSLNGDLTYEGEHYVLDAAWQAHDMNVDAQCSDMSCSDHWRRQCCNNWCDVSVLKRPPYSDVHCVESAEIHPNPNPDEVPAWTVKAGDVDWMNAKLPWLSVVDPQDHPLPEEKEVVTRKGEESAASSWALSLFTACSILGVGLIF